MNLHRLQPYAPIVILPAMLAACGGGGGGGGNSGPPATVSAMTVAATRYGQLATVSITGTHLDTDLVVSSTACKNFSRTDDGTSSTNITLVCKVSGALTGSLQATSRTTGSTLFTTNFTVPAPQVTMALSNGLGVSGNLVVALSPDKAPITVDNFLTYVNAGFYTGTIIHRVAPGFVIQGGGYTTAGTLKATNAPIVLESNVGLHNIQWSIAMARTGEPNSATSQFFVNLVDNSTRLDYVSAGNPGYAVFGSVSTSADVVNAIVAAPCTATNLGECKPNPDVVVTGAIQTQ